MADYNYYVVLEQTGEMGGVRGIRTITCFSNKKEFDKWYDDDMKRIEKVVAEGVSREEATKLCDETPFHCRWTAAVKESIGPDGEIFTPILEMELRNLIYYFNTAAKGGEIDGYNRIYG